MTIQNTPQPLGHSPNAWAQRQDALLQFVRSTLPELLSDNQLDLHKLKAWLDDTDATAPDEHYELTWAGKTDARREVQKTTSHTLRPSANNPAQASHMLIEGENLEVLRVLQRSYYGKVKMIYIDPPYNTGNDSFVYPDDYSETLDEYQKRTGEKNEAGYLNKQSLWKKNSKESGQYHSAWLSMMYPRLYLARNLLRDDGVIFISIDDNEAANLKLLCDEVFGAENFIVQFSRVTKRGGKSTDVVSKSNDQLLFYGKTNCPKLYPFEHTNEGFKHEDENSELRGKYKLNQTLDYDTLGYVSSLDYPIEIDENTYYAGGVTEKEYIERKAANPKDGFRWRWSEKLTKFGLKNGFVVLKTSRNGSRIYTKTYQLATIDDDGVGGYEIVYEERTKTISSLDFVDNKYSNDNAKKEAKRILGNSIFDYPKPSSLVFDIAKYCTAEKDLVLDFFAGSGTTAHAVMALNAEDGGSRQSISVQLPELIEEDSEAYKAGYRTIADITRARIAKVIEKLKAEHPDKTADLACAHFTLAPSNFQVWRSHVDNPDALREQLALFKKAEKSTPQTDARAMLAELLLKHGLGALGVHAKSDSHKVGKATVHCVPMQGERTMWLCFDPYTPALRDALVKARPAQVVLLNSCFAGAKADEQLSNLQLELATLDIRLTVI